MQALEQEQLRVLLLDTRNHVLDTVEIYRGSVNTAQVRPADVFKPAVRKNATAIIVSTTTRAATRRPARTTWP